MTRILALVVATLASFAGAEHTESAQPPSDQARMVSQLAIDTLAAELGLPRDQIVVESVNAVEWRDSSLGCPQPGNSYLDVITPGYKVTLRAAGQLHVVHEAGERAIVCRKAKGPGGGATPKGLGFGLQMAAARKDLSSRLGVPPEEIEFVSRAKKTWNDSSLGCPEPGMQYMQVITDGSVLTFRHGERQFTYHADDNHAIPCPPIPAN
jgi:hypothetical protein